MREHKYRAWNRVTKKMWWFDLMWGNMHAVGSGWIGMVDSPTETKKSRAFSGDNRTQVDPDDCEIMDYIGLKDKNNKEVFEGDIVKEYRVGIGCGSLEKWEEISKQVMRIATVTWCDDELTFMVDDTRVGVLNGWNNLEVIGNIHENPELMEKE